MATSKNAKIEIETGQTYVAATAMTSSDDQIFTVSGGSIFSGKSGFEPTVMPGGMVTGRNVLTVHASNDTVTVAAFTAYSKGVLQSVGATTATISRPATATRAQIFSITMASDGSIATVEGTISADTNFSETRNAAGGPPYIPATSVEIGQIRTTSSTPAAIASTEIFQVIGTHAERYDQPVWEENNIGDGESAEASTQKNAYVKFASALPGIHTGGTAKEVYISYYTPIMSEVARAIDFVPAEKSHSVSSTQVYRSTVGAVSETLGQGGFTALTDDNVTGALELNKNQVLTVRFYPDENKAPYILTQGTIGLARTFPVDNQNQASVTISAESQSAEFAS